MAKKEFDNVTGKLKPDYPRPKIPKKLDKVKNPGNSEDGSFGWKELPRILYLFLLKQGEGLLPNEKVIAKNTTIWGSILTLLTALLSFLMDWVF